jgi:hypothetical protein
MMNQSKPKNKKKGLEHYVFLSLFQPSGELGIPLAL